MFVIQQFLPLHIFWNSGYVQKADIYILWASQLVLWPLSLFNAIRWTLHVIKLPKSNTSRYLCFFYILRRSTQWILETPRAIWAEEDLILFVMPVTYIFKLSFYLENSFVRINSENATIIEWLVRRAYVFSFFGGGCSNIDLPSSSHARKFLHIEMYLFYDEQIKFETRWSASIL